MDILKYAAVNAVNLQTSIIANANTSARQLANDTANAAFAGLGLLDANNWQANGTTYVASQTHLGAQWCNGYNNMPWCQSSWADLVPRMPGSANTSHAGYIPGSANTEYCGFKVCAPNFFGANSAVWTVPAGVQYARFQIWGGGGSSGSGCCCGGSTWGTSGAYASVIIPVVPGCQYTLCAGCARACPTLWGSNFERGCMSYVTGYGLSNFCADGAPRKSHHENLYLDIGAYSASGCCFWAAPWCFAAGGCVCNTGSDYCTNGSCSSCGIIGMSKNTATLFYGCYTGGTFYTNIKDIGFTKGMQVVGLPGLNGSMCWDTSTYGWGCAPAVYGYEANTTSCICMQGSSIGGVRCNHVSYDYRRAPGAGGTMVQLYGGCTAICDTASGICATACGGDIGRSGMVCVTYY